MRILLSVFFLSSVCFAQEQKLNTEQADAPAIIQEVSLMVSGAQEEHFKGAIENFRNIFRAHQGIQIGSLTVVGDPTSVTEKIYPLLNPGLLTPEFKNKFINKVMIPKPEGLTAEEDDQFRSSIADGMKEVLMSDPEVKLFFEIAGQLHVTQELPKELNVTKSPTWLLKTSKGTILLEGVLEPENFISEKNEFIEKGGMSDQGLSWRSYSIN